MTANILMNIPAVSAVAVIVWLIRLEGRVNTHEAVCAERYRQMEERHMLTLSSLSAIDTKLDKMMSQ